jgi:hypothetical protein
MAERLLTFYDDVGGLERYLNVPAGTLRQISIYARIPAVDAILKVREMEYSTLFRPGLYYIVLADLVGNTAFNAKYGHLNRCLKAVCGRALLPSAKETARVSSARPYSPTLMNS